jgi:hypothetical protein
MHIPQKFRLARLMHDEFLRLEHAQEPQAGLIGWN